MAEKKLNLLNRLPAAFLGLLLGVTFGNIAGNLFVNMQIGNPNPISVAVFIFLGALFGAIIGYNYEE